MTPDRYLRQARARRCWSERRSSSATPTSTCRRSSAPRRGAARLRRLALAARRARGSTAPPRRRRGPAGRLALALLRAQPAGGGERGGGADRGADEEGARSRAPRRLLVHGRIVGMIVSLGDLLLDVIVRLAQPLAEGADADATTRLGPGGQAANVAAWVARARRAGAVRRQTGRRRGRGEIAASRARALRRRGSRARRRGPHRHGRLARRARTARARWPPTAASRPTSRSGELDPAWLDGCTHLHLPGYSLLRSPIDAAALRAAELAPRVSVDLSSWSAIRDFGPERFRERLRGAPAGDRVRERGRGADPRRPAARAATWVLKRGSLGARFGERRAAGAARRGRSTRPARATRSRPATSSAGRSSRSRRRHAASRN